MQEILIPVAIVTALLLIALSGGWPRFRRVDALARRLQALPIQRLTQLQHELRMRMDDIYADSHKGTPRPDRKLPLLMLLVDLKCEADRIENLVGAIRYDHRDEIAQLKLTYDELLDRILSENPYVKPFITRATTDQLKQAEAVHRQRCERSAKIRFDYNQRVREWLQIANILVQNANSEAEHAFREHHGNGN